ncbi:MAG: glycogen synthase GlgA [Planctomycetota bacterium]|nr:glycogen synthase GlgA [Planctomycetota bacterium]
MKILFATSEAVPFAKTGGLADVSSALSQALSAQGAEVWMIMPFYRGVREELNRRGMTPIRCGSTLRIRLGNKLVEGQLYVTVLPGTSVPVILVDQPTYFQRNGLYQEHGRDYADNSERFIFFSRSLLEATRLLGFHPNVIHVNDWQTGMVPALLAIEGRAQPQLKETRSVITIHNLSFQGSFWHWDMLLTGLDWKYFNWHQMEFFGQLNLLKTGIVFSDLITTVSPSYAKEIQTSAFGCGMQGVLQTRHDDLVGILNGIDTAIWNPATDATLPETYDIDSLAQGKARCKAELQKELGLPVECDAPLAGMISRLTDQKGIDLIIENLETLLATGLQLVFLGSGESRYETALVDAARQHAGQIAVKIGFDEALAHRIEAGADMYLMPSRYEPCGLNQMYSLQYGTVPIVHAGGGLADTVTAVSHETLANGTATGFVFTEYLSSAFIDLIQQSVQLFARRDIWTQIVQNGMRQDWSWHNSAKRYLEVYDKVLSRPVHATLPVHSDNSTGPVSAGEAGAGR